MPLVSVAIYAAIYLAALAPTPVQSKTVDRSVSMTSEPSATGAKKKPATKKKATEKTARAVFDNGSAETVAQRNARLKRECKGGVNAGACAGFTR